MYIYTHICLCIYIYIYIYIEKHLINRSFTSNVWLGWLHHNINFSFVFFVFYDNCRFFTGVNTFWIVQNNKPVIDAINGLNKQRKPTSVSTFDFSTLYTKLLHNKLLMLLNSLIDFCFDGGESKYITVNNYGALWVKIIKDNRICLNKQQIKDEVYLLFNCYFTVGPNIFCQIIGILMGSDPAPFFANLFLHFYESKWMNELI